MTQTTYSRHLIDQQLLPALEMLPNFDFTPDNLPEIRTNLGKLFEGIELPFKPIKNSIHGPDGMVDIYLFDPAPGGNERPGILFIHGGGMVMGSAQALSAARLAAGLNVPVASVEYRLAPETPFPGPQEDCYAALVWLAAHSGELGIDRERIAIFGESAGGGLAASVAQMTRDRAGPKLAAQILAYPMLDHRVGGESDPWRNRHTGEFVWTRSSNQFGWESLRGDYVPNDFKKGWFSPSLADDLRDLPPAWIGVGCLDLFFDEDLDYARRLVDAGVPVELHTYAGAYHGFDMTAEALTSTRFNRDMKDGILQLLAMRNEDNS